MMVERPNPSRHTFCGRRRLDGRFSCLRHLMFRIGSIFLRQFGYGAPSCFCLRQSRCRFLAQHICRGPSVLWHLNCCLSLAKSPKWRLHVRIKSIYRPRCKFCLILRISDHQAIDQHPAAMAAKMDWIGLSALLSFRARFYFPGYR